MLTALDLYKRISSELQKEKDSKVKYFIYLDSCSYHELVRDIESSNQSLNDIWNKATRNFMGNTIFQVENSGFHFNIIKML